MPENSKRRHVFVSHHHKDDAAVTRLMALVKRRHYEFRNSSIRAKPANRERLEKGLVSDEKIRRLLRMKISWAGSVIVLIGKQTHSRKWVNWEIQEAYRQGKRIVGVFDYGGTNANIPEAFKQYGSALVAWNADSIIDAIDGIDHPFQNPDGTPAPPMHSRTVTVC